MTAFIWTIIVLLIIGTIAKLICLAIGYLPPRNKGATVVDVVINIAMLVWAFMLVLK